MKRIILSALLFLPILATSQILKVDKGAINNDSANFFLGNVNFNFNINNRSATAEEEITFVGLTANADLVYLTEQHAYILINNINYFQSTGGPLISTGFAHFRINFARKNALSYESYTQIQYDDGRNMPLRRLIGSGIKYQVTETDNSELHLGIGIMYEYEDWRSFEDNQIITKEIWKNSSYVGFQSNINDHINFNGIIYFQGGIDTQSNLFRSRISGELSLSFDITEKLAFNTTFVSQYEDRPIIQINNWVYALTNGLRWSF